MGHHDFASLARLVQDIAVFNAPFVYRDGEHALAATDPAYPRRCRTSTRSSSRKALRIIGRLFRGERHMTANYAVYSPEDLRQALPRRSDPALDVDDQGLRRDPDAGRGRRTADRSDDRHRVGQENPLTMIAANKLYEVQPHVMLTGHMRTVLPVFINERLAIGFGEGPRRYPRGPRGSPRTRESRRKGTPADRRTLKDLPS